MRTQAFRAAALIAAVFACGLVGVKSLGQDIPTDHHYYAPDAVNYLKTHYPQGRFLNHYNMGGAMIWLGRGNPPVFMDSRAGTAYPEQVLKDYFVLINHCQAREAGRVLFGAYKLGGVIFPTAPELAKNLECWRKDADFESVYKDKKAEIFLKKHQ